MILPPVMWASSRETCSVVRVMLKLQQLARVLSFF